MLLKRKRSESEMSFASSSTISITSASPTPSDSATCTSVHPMAMPYKTLVDSRTIKRYRNNRPEDAIVHREFYKWPAHLYRPYYASHFSHAVSAERTLDMLYTAQRAQCQPTSAQPFEPPLTNTPIAAELGRPQASLHSFWNLPKPAMSSMPSSQRPMSTMSFCDATSCDDCGQALGRAASDDTMDVDTFDVDVPTNCVVCRKNVCSHCSITNLGEERRCLKCAGRKVWVGGVGWSTTTSHMRVC
ncbi:hypothetical protein F5Y15DRAFT_314997 [Xylariaceae sp. FL0016]|nr:hypothetical protein F5Y15DRAFT_314997 [Xylariaceae sp. FL0016]